MPDTMDDGAMRIDLEPMRPGVRSSIRTLWQNVRDGKPSTGIVLPTRYGKSDVIKMGGLGLLLNSLASYIVILEPATILAQQILDPKRMEVSAKRYYVPSAVANGITRWVMRDSPKKPFPPRDAKFVSLTVQMANLNREFFAEWVRHLTTVRGLPAPVFFVDEAHTGSVDNQWGATARALQDAGSHLVLLTATPNRTDKTFIEGFNYEQVRTEPTTVRRGQELWRGERTTYRLLPDHETTFREAWAELPPALCYISRIPIACEMGRFGFDADGQKEAVDISEVPAYQVRAALGEVVRDPEIVKACATKFTELLRERQAAVSATAGIVFVGNDTENDIEDNAHARQVADALLKCDGNLNVKVATSTSGDNPQGVIDEFQNGTGDVLIVKQMGGVGMDVPRLKVCLDLSTFRTESLFVQRICRVATIWQPTDDPEDLVLTGTYLTPDDPFSDALFENFFRREGGDAEQVTPSELDYIRTEGSGGIQRLPDWFEPTGNTGIGQLKDTEQRTAPGKELGLVQRLRNIFPELTKRRTEPELANIISAEGISIDSENGVHNGATKSPPDLPVEVLVRDLNAEHKLARGKAARAGRQVANKRKRDGDTDPYVYASVFMEHKRRCGLPVRKELEDMEIADLERMTESLLKELGS